MHKNYGLNELREMFLKFFETKGHLRLPSFSLIPQNDASLLLINSGMAPMKPWFTGEQEPPRHRVTTCQKCIRTGDIENIGHTARHGTYFEMLGNFSFGDYFKRDAIHWAWEFLTSPEWVGLEADRLYPSVFAGNETTPADDEAFRIWNEEIGIPAERIFKFGKEDNFWEHGSGPCGPCSEIYYDRGPEWGCGKPGCTVGCDCDRYIEVWNIVFSQFDNDGEGHYTELKQKNIDTGMGLERLACVCQNVASLFDVDTVMNITNKVVRDHPRPLRRDRRQGRVSTGDHRPHPLLRVYDLRRRAPLQRGPGLRAPPPAAPGRPPRQAAGRQRALPLRGVMIDFRNTVIIMTSNAGTRQLKEFGRGIGFTAGGAEGFARNEKDKEYARSIIQKSLSKQFSPEFLNRLDEIITFDQLDLNAIKQIVEIELKGLYKRVGELGYALQLSDAAKEFVAKKGYDVQFGARPLKRAIQNYVEDGLSERILSGEMKEGDSILVNLTEDGSNLSFDTQVPDHELF